MSAPLPASPTDPEWLDALIERIADLSPAQRTQLWRRLRVAGLLPGGGIFTDRGRLAVARAVSARPPLLPSPPPPLLPRGHFVPALPHAAAVPLTFPSTGGSKIVIGAVHPALQMRPQDMLPLPGQAPEAPILLAVRGDEPGFSAHSQGSYILRWPAHAPQTVRLRFSAETTTLLEAAYDTLIAGLESILARLAAQEAAPATARLHLIVPHALLARHIKDPQPAGDPRLQGRQRRAQQLLARFGSWRAEGAGPEDADPSTGVSSSMI